MFFLEILIQITIASRLAAGYFFYILSQEAEENDVIMIFYVFFGLFFTEMLPLIVILFGVNS